jgi:hypothetical protein
VVDRVSIDAVTMKAARRAVILFACTVSSLAAGTITFTYVGNVTGTLNGTPVTNAPFVLMFAGNVNGTNYIPVSGSLAITGFAPATLTNTESAYYEALNPLIPSAMLSMGSDSFAALLSNGPDWNNWNPASPSSIGPEHFFPWFGPPVVYQTSLGTFDLNGVSSGLFGSNAGELFVGATAPGILVGFQGGASSAPVPLPGGQTVTEITGTIGGLQSQDYYTFLWAGGAFSATASIAGTPDAGSSYLFSEGISGGCSGGATASLSSSDSFTSTIAVANLPAGQYCIGIDTLASSDPYFVLNFNTPVSDAPEPSSIVFLCVGLGILGALRFTRRERREF